MRQSQFLNQIAIRSTLFVLALGCVAIIIWRVGPELIFENLRRVGWKISLIFLIGFPRFFLNTLAWKIFLPGPVIPLRRLYWLKVSGELLSRATPVHFVGGDAARVVLLGRTLPNSQAAACVLMDRTAMFLGGAVFILMGLFASAFLMPLPMKAKAGMSALGLFVFTALLFLIAKQKQGMLSSLLRLFPKRFRGRFRNPFAAVDATVRSYYEQGHGKLVAAAGLDFTGRVVTSLEIYLLFLFLDIPLGPLHAMVFFSTSLLLAATLFVIPGALGIAEGTYGLFFHLLGLNPAVGVSLELSRKVNAVLWYVFGGFLALFLRNPKPSDKA